VVPLPEGVCTKRIARKEVGQGVPEASGPGRLGGIRRRVATRRTERCPWRGTYLARRVPAPFPRQSARGRPWPAKRKGDGQRRPGRRTGAGPVVPVPVPAPGPPPPPPPGCLKAPVAPPRAPVTAPSPDPVSATPSRLATLANPPPSDPLPRGVWSSLGGLCAVTVRSPVQRPAGAGRRRRGHRGCLAAANARRDALPAIRDDLPATSSPRCSPCDAFPLPTVAPR